MKAPWLLANILGGGSEWSGKWKAPGKQPRNMKTISLKGTDKNQPSEPKEIMNLSHVKHMTPSEPKVFFLFRVTWLVLSSSSFSRHRRDPKQDHELRESWVWVLLMLLGVLTPMLNLHQQQEKKRVIHQGQRITSPAQHELSLWGPFHW